jgi:hypothetical protein
MAVTYTNRKGKTYYLHQGVTRTGKPRYYFSRNESGNPVEEIPEGYEISESINGVVSLARERPKKILPEEVAIVEAAIKRHEDSSKYRVNVRSDEIEIYERVGMNPISLPPMLRAGLLGPGSLQQLEEDAQARAQYTPILRFILQDEEKRKFGIMRMCYLGSIDDWISIGGYGSLDMLARKVIPLLGTDRYFNLY